MSEYFDRYKNRLRRNGSDVGQAYENNTVALINSTFSASPTFKVIKVISEKNPELTKIDSRVIEVQRMGTLKELLFRPNEQLNIGTYVEFNDKTWIVFDTFGGGTTAKCMIAECNRTLKWVDKSGVLQEFYCSASATDLGSKSKQSKNELEWNKYDVKLPLGQLFVFVTTNKNTTSIALNTRFIFGSKVYEVTGYDDVTTVDNDGYGVMQLTVKLTTTRDGDDFKNKLAVNGNEKDNVDMGGVW